VLRPRPVRSFAHELSGVFLLRFNIEEASRKQRRSVAINKSTESQINPSCQAVRLRLDSLIGPRPLFTASSLLMLSFDY